MKPFSVCHRKRYTALFIGIFYALAFYKWLNGMWLYQMQPCFFNTRMDGVTWLFMQSGLHQWLLNNKSGWLLFDGLFYTIPLLYYWIFTRSAKWVILPGMTMLIINWLYVQCYTLYPTNSIEIHISWLLCPLLFMTIRLESFYYVMHGMRYFFLFFFASAGLWKIYQGGVFHSQQMSAILLMQHKEYLISAPDDWYSHFIYWLIGHKWVSFALYIAGTFLELLFIIGFFTKKLDMILLLLFIVFLIMDLLLMRIAYFEVLPLALPLLFSSYRLTETIDRQQINTFI